MVRQPYPASRDSLSHEMLRHPLMIIKPLTMIQSAQTTILFHNTNLKGMELQLDMGMASAIASTYHKVDTTDTPSLWLCKYLQTEKKTLLQ